MKTILFAFVFTFGVQATRLGDFADSIPAGQWTVFPTPTLTAALIASPPSGSSLAYNQQAVWDSTTNRLMNIGAAHGTGMSRAILYDATTDNWRSILTPREPATNSNRLGHNYDHLAIIPDSGIAYCATYTAYNTTDNGYLYRYHFATDKWDTARALFPNGTAYDENYVYGGALEYVPEWGGFAMQGGNYGKACFLDLTTPNPDWSDFSALSAMGGVHTILDWNPVFKTLLFLTDIAGGFKIVDVNKQARAINRPPFIPQSYNTKIACDPVTGTHLAYWTDAKKLYAYEQSRDLWQEVAADNQATLTNVNEETIIFKIEKYGIIGIISNEPRCILFKYARQADTLLTAFDVTASKYSIEEFLDTTSLITIANNSAGGCDTVTKSCFYVSLDTLIANVLPGGKVVPAENSLRGPARIEVTMNTAHGIWRDTVVVSVVNTAAVLDSLVLNQHSLILMPGDQYPLVLMAYYRLGSRPFIQMVDVEDVWSSDNNTVAIVKRATVSGVAPGYCTLYARMGVRSDSVMVKVMLRPQYIKRIDFRGTGADNLHLTGWNEDYGQFGQYDDNRRGYGFTDGAAGGWTSMSDQTNYLVEHAIYPNNRVGNYKMTAPDGVYAVKMAMRYAGSWVTCGNDTLCKAIDNTVVTKTDTITVSNGSGAIFNINGTISYLVLLSCDGTVMDSVAWDREPLALISDSAFQAMSISGNIALGKTATQSSTYLGATASRAVDGNTDGNWNNNSISHTNGYSPAWWMVDLEKTTNISRIKIFNRTDAYPNQLSKYNVSILDENQGEVWSTYQEDYPNPSIDIDAFGKKGRFVKVELVGPTNGAYYLALAEVQVFEAAQAPNTNIAVPNQLDFFSFKLAPNPFNPLSAITLTLPKAMKVGLTVLDIKGRTLKTIKPVRFEAGKQTLVWNGTDDNGIKVTSGVYFYRLTAGNRVVVSKGILTK